MLGFLALKSESAVKIAGEGERTANGWTKVTISCSSSRSVAICGVSASRREPFDRNSYRNSPLLVERLALASLLSFPQTRLPTR